MQHLSVARTTGRPIACVVIGTHLRESLRERLESGQTFNPTEAEELRTVIEEIVSLTGSLQPESRPATVVPFRPPLDIQDFRLILKLLAEGGNRGELMRCWLRQCSAVQAHLHTS